MRLAVYSAPSGNLIRTLPGNFHPGDADLSQDGRWLVAGTPITFSIREVQTGKTVFIERREFPWGMAGPNVTALKFDPSGHHLLTINSPKGLRAVYAS